MILDINNKLNELFEEIHKKEKLQKRIKEAEISILNKEKEIKEHEEILKKEKKDVEKMKSFSLINLLTTLSGNKDDKLTKEESEYLDAKIYHDRLIFELDELKSNLEYNKKRISSIELLEEEYNKLLDKKKSLIEDVSPEYKKIIQDSTDELNNIRKEIVEIKEALRAGDNCIRYLQRSKDVLKSAGNWGTADIFFSKSMFISMIKHQKIDEASKLISLTKSHIVRYKKELSDVDINLNSINLEFSGLLKTFDIFFDNIFTDFSVQNKINQAQANISNIYNKVKSSMDNLDKLRATKEKELKDQQSKLDNIILQYT